MELLLRERTLRLVRFDKGSRSVMELLMSARLVRLVRFDRG
jgi:hypothetical protein